MRHSPRTTHHAHHQQRTKNLPVYVTQQELQENPGFAALLQELSQNHLSKDGISKEKATKLEHCTISLQKEKTQYLQSLLYYTTINDLLLDRKLDTTSTSSLDDNRFYEMLARALNRAEACAVLRDNPDLGLRVDAQAVREFQIGNEEAVKQQTKILGTTLLPKLEALFEEKCITIADFYDPTTQKKELQLAKSLKLAEIVANKKKELVLLEESIKADALHNTRSFWEYYKILENVIISLYTMIRTHKLREENTDQYDPNELTAEFLKTKLESLKLKSELVERELLQETYSERENVKPLEGLQTIASHLKQALEQARWAHEKAVMRKSQYDSVGLGLTDLATEYGKLLRTIANKEWALSQLNAE